MPSPWLHSHFVAFLRMRGILRHFRRHPMLESLCQHGQRLPYRPRPAPIFAILLRWR
jgi:hypothetical protein